MAKLESTFVNMVVVLTTITCVVGAALGGVYELTKDPIAAVDKQKQEEAIKMVAPTFDNSPADEKIIKEIDGGVVTIFPAKLNGELVGAAVESFTMMGFSGYIKVMVGFEKEGTIRNYTILQHQETPGLGSKMQEWFRGEKGRQSVLGLHPVKNKMKVAKDGGEVDAITAATITSRAFLDAIERAYKQFAEIASGSEKGGNEQ